MTELRLLPGMADPYMTVQHGLDAGHRCSPSDDCNCVEALLHSERRQWAAEVARLQARLPCGHPAELLVRTTESQTEWCDLCDTRRQRNDAEKIEAEALAEVQRLRQLTEGILATAENQLNSVINAPPGTKLISVEVLLQVLTARLHRALYPARTS